MKTTSIELGGRPLERNVVHVSVPAHVLFDRASMAKVTDGILGRLGCPGCHSGWDIRFGLIQEFLVDEKLNIQNATRGGVGIGG